MGKAFVWYFQRGCERDPPRPQLSAPYKYSVQFFCLLVSCEFSKRVEHDAHSCFFQLVHGWAMIMNRPECPWKRWGAHPCRTAPCHSRRIPIHAQDCPASESSRAGGQLLWGQTDCISASKSNLVRRRNPLDIAFGSTVLVLHGRYLPNGSWEIVYAFMLDSYAPEIHTKKEERVKGEGERGGGGDERERERVICSLHSQSWLEGNVYNE